MVSGEKISRADRDLERHFVLARAGAGMGMKLQWFAPYQMERLAVYLGQKELPQNSMYYFLRNYMGESRLLGPGNFSGTLMENVESYNGDYIFPFISAKYGILAAVLLVALVLQ